MIALLRDGFGVDVRTKRELEENNKKNRSILVEKRFFARTLCRARLCEKRSWFLVSSMVLMKERRTTEWFSSTLEGETRWRKRWLERMRVDQPREQVVKAVKALQTKTKKEELMRMMGEGRSVMERLKRESTSSLWMSG